MDAELKKNYEEMAGLFEEWYEIEKERIMEAFCQYGHAKVFEKPELAGLNEEQVEKFKQMWDVVKFMQEHGGRIKI